MAARRRVVESAFSDEEVAELARLARSRTEPASRVERARMLLAYREVLSFYAVGRDIGVTHQTVERCVRRAERLGVLAALDDSPRPGREPMKRGCEQFANCYPAPRSQAFGETRGRISHRRLRERSGLAQSCGQPLGIFRS